jgi:hypothetical protein
LEKLASQWSMSFPSRESPVGIADLILTIFGGSESQKSEGDRCRH